MAATGSRPTRDRGVQPLRDGRAVHGRRDRTCRSIPLRSYFETDLPTANPLIREIESPYGDEQGLRGAAAQAGRDDRPRPARRCRRQHPGLGPARLPEGGGVRGRPGDRRRRGARGRGGHPRGPEPDDHPGADRGRRGRRAVRARIRRTSRAPTTATTASTSTGTRSPGTRQPSRRGCATGSTISTGGPPTSRSSGPSASRRFDPGSAPSGSVDYGEYR